MRFKRQCQCLNAIFTMSPTKIIPNTATMLFWVCATWWGFVPEMIRFSRNDSLINSDLLTPTGGFNFTFKASFIIKMTSSINIQRLMFNISKQYFCICNCRLNAFMSCIKQCVNASKCHFRCSFCVDFTLLVTAQMSYYSNSLIKCNNLAQKIMDTLKKYIAL